MVRTMMMLSGTLQCDTPIHTHRHLLSPTTLLRREQGHPPPPPPTKEVAVIFQPPEPPLVPGGQPLVPCRPPLVRCVAPLVHNVKIRCKVHQKSHLCLWAKGGGGGGVAIQVSHVYRANPNRMWKLDAKFIKSPTYVCGQRGERGVYR